MQSAINYTDVLPYEIIVQIMYKHKGLEHPIAKIMKKRIEIVSEYASYMFSELGDFRIRWQYIHVDSIDTDYMKTLESWILHYNIMASENIMVNERLEQQSKYFSI